MHRRTGFEIELLAPEGSDRCTLAAKLAGRLGGSVRQVLGTSSEPSAVPGMGFFWHLITVRGGPVEDET